MRHSRMLTSLRAARFGSACLGVLAGLAASASAATTVNVVLTDPSSDSSLQGMRIIASPDTAKAGTVTFQVTNRSQRLVHEMIVVRQPAGGKPLPYNSRVQRVVESRIKSLGEVSELDPGRSGKLTVTLRPGEYLLFCNQASHYKSGMSTKLNVER